MSEMLIVVRVPGEDRELAREITQGIVPVVAQLRPDLRYDIVVVGGDVATRVLDVLGVSD